MSSQQQVRQDLTMTVRCDTFLHPIQSTLHGLLLNCPVAVSMSLMSDYAMSGKYYPNNWEAWHEMPEDFLHSPTWEEFEDWKLRGWEIPSSVCCIIRANTKKGKVKEYVYQQQHAAENRIRTLMAEGVEFTVCTEDQIRHVTPVTDEHYLD